MAVISMKFYAQCLWLGGDGPYNQAYKLVSSVYGCRVAILMEASGSGSKKAS